MLRGSVQCCWNLPQEQKPFLHFFLRWMPSIVPMLLSWMGIPASQPWLLRPLGRAQRALQLSLLHHCAGSKNWAFFVFFAFAFSDFATTLVHYCTKVYIHTECCAHNLCEMISWHVLAFPHHHLSWKRCIMLEGQRQKELSGISCSCSQKAQ